MRILNKILLILRMMVLILWIFLTSGDLNSNINLEVGYMLEHP